MQLVNATVLLNGDRNFALPKENLSVAEVVVLRRLHGEDAVLDIQPTRKTTISLRDYREQMMTRYGDTKAKAAIVADVFQNVHLQGLTEMSDIVAPETDGRSKKSAAKGVKAGDLDSKDAEDDQPKE